MSVKPLVEVEQVSVSFGPVRVLEDVTLAVYPGEFLGIIGPNGSGKTTLLRVMLGLIRPDSGGVRLFGKPPEVFREWGRLGYVPQRVTLDPALPATAREVVENGASAKHRLIARRNTGGRARVDEVLGLVGMQAHARTRMGTLSPGQQQRILIARALVSDPELLILDEPTAGVDPDTQTGFYALLRHLNRERGVTLTLVSHDIGAVTREVTKLACLNRRLAFHGPPDAFLSDAALSALYGASMRLVTHDHP
jgi:zinc transport system ATP-binding protein